MKLKLICYLKSGAVVSDELEFIESVTIEDVNDARVEFKKRINDCIKNKESGTVSFGYTHINVQEISAYSLTIEGGEYKQCLSQNLYAESWQPSAWKSCC